MYSQFLLYYIQGSSYIAKKLKEKTYHQTELYFHQKVAQNYVCNPNGLKSFKIDLKLHYSINFLCYKEVRIYLQKMYYCNFTIV